MDFKTQLLTGILFTPLGIYLIIQGFRMAILKKKILIFMDKFYIWFYLKTSGEKSADKYKFDQLTPKRQLLDGITYLITGGISLAIGLLLLIDLF